MLQRAALSTCCLTWRECCWRISGQCLWCTAVLAPCQCPHCWDTATTLCPSQSVTRPQLHLHRFAPLSCRHAWQQGFCPAESLGNRVLVRALLLSELKIGRPYRAWGHTGKRSLLQASTVPGQVAHQLQAAGSEPEDEGQTLLPASGTEPAVPQRKWFRDRQILLCLAGTGLITLVSSRLLTSWICAQVSALCPHCRRPAALM